MCFHWRESWVAIFFFHRGQSQLDVFSSNIFSDNLAGGTLIQSMQIELAWRWRCQSGWTHKHARKYTHTYKHTRAHTVLHRYLESNKFVETQVICLAMTNIRHTHTHMHACGALGFGTCNYLYTFSEDTRNKLAYFQLLIVNSNVAASFIDTTASTQQSLLPSCTSLLHVAVPPHLVRRINQIHGRYASSLHS